MDCEIVLIGNELLIGKIQDSNGKWIIDQLVPHGIRITRIITIPDRLDAISKTIQEELIRAPDYIFTSGGLGPTFDDMTLEGIALGLNPPRLLIQNEDALKMIISRYQNRYPEQKIEEILTSSRKKMAKLPEGSQPLLNLEGSAPGVYFPTELTNGKTKIISFPGVPHELKAIFNSHILPEILKKLGNSHFYQCGFTFFDVGESKFTEIIYQIKDDYPDIWIKTHPKANLRSEVELHLTSFSSNENIIQRMEEIYKRLMDYVLKSGGIIKESHPISKN